MERILRDLLADQGRSAVPENRSRIMAAIRGRGNKSTEWRLRGGLIRAGLRGWVLHPNGVEGVPDFWFPQRRVAIFVDGCFWHGCLVCRGSRSMKSAFWNAKISGTVDRDKRTARRLQNRGITVIRIWEHELRGGVANSVRQITARLSVRSRSRVRVRRIRSNQSL